MVEKDNIKDLFSEKLAQYEVPVRPELWQGIASQVAKSSVIGGGLSLGAKVAIGIGVVVSITGGILFFNNDSKKDSQSKIVQVSSEKSNETPIEELLLEEESSTDIEVVSTFTANNTSDEQPTNTVNRPDYVQDYIDYIEVPAEIIRELPVVKPKIVEQQQEEVPAIDEVSTENPILEKEIPALVVEKEQSTVLAEITKVPNIFTPNGDRDNDEFFIEYSGELEDYQIVIMNAQNQVLYQTNNPDFIWNGTSLSGEQVAEGSYYFILTARDKNKNPINKYGQITVRR